jgi:transcriptional regulator with XRE-family HTH domain
MDEHPFLISELTDKEAREQYAADLLDSYIALQIKTLRQQRGWSQEDLAALAGKHQSQISAMEQIDFRSWKISTLQRLANAFDLALVVRFESFGTFLREILPVERGALERLSFADDPEFKSSGTLGTVVASITPRSTVLYCDFQRRSRIQESPGSSVASQNTTTISRSVGEQRRGLG